MLPTAFGPLGQLGYAVHDAEGWVRNYVAAGVGPWWMSRNLAPQSFVYRGVQSEARFDCAVSFSGDLMIELIQPLDDHPSPYRDYLATGREGLQHVAFFPEDSEAAREWLRTRDYKVALDGRSRGFHFTYYEAPVPIFDMIELGELDDATRERFAMMKAACAGWDGAEVWR